MPTTDTMHQRSQSRSISAVEFLSVDSCKKNPTGSKSAPVQVEQGQDIWLELSDMGRDFLCHLEHIDLCASAKHFR